MSEAWLDWQPINTFPIDGKPYLLCCKTQPPYDDWYAVGSTHPTHDKDNLDRIHVGTANFARSFFTHWAKIPQP